MMNCIPARKRKPKRKSRQVELTSINKKWISCDIDTDVAFNNGSSVDGFMELEELHDYDEDEIQAITRLHNKKGKKSQASKNGSDTTKQLATSSGTIIVQAKEIVSDNNSDNDGDNNDLEKSNDKIELDNKFLNDGDKHDLDKSNNKIELDNKILNDGDENILSEGDKIVPDAEDDDLNNETVNDEDLSKKITQSGTLSKKERRKQARKLSFKLKLKERRKKFKEMKRLKAQNEEVSVDQLCDAVINKCESFELKSQVRTNMSEWLGLGVPDEVLKALSDNNFTVPTPIQRECLPQSILYRQDIIGAAETGSGKTLAFGIPLIKSIMEMKKSRNDDEDVPLYALIISPTRELALQIKNHIQTAAKYTDLDCVAIVGGLSTAKQERLISKCPEIVVGTPGRLHKLLTDGCEHLNKFETLKHLVIDEADRMLERGHFKELSDILEIIGRVKVKRQIFVMSATLTLPQHHKNYAKKKKQEEESEMQMLIDKVGLNPKAKIIDLTPKHVTASQLDQLRVMCSDDEKDIYLVYFLLLHPGRSIIFVNSIPCTRRLCSLLSLLGFSAFPLHSGKQQRQRLKFLDRFTSSENGLLIATDVAARGLDIPKVSNVVHYQLPSNPKVYVHRAGRTARANETGISFILEGPEDFTALKKISVVLKLAKDIPSLKVDHKIVQGIKVRVALAREIDHEEHKIRKQNADSTWLKRTADSMELETEGGEPTVLTKREKLRQSAKRKQLQTLLAEKLYPSGFSGNYPTKGGGLVIPSLSMHSIE